MREKHETETEVEGDRRSQTLRKKGEGSGNVDRVTNESMR